MDLACPDPTCLHLLHAHGDATPDDDGQVTIPFTKFDRPSQRHIRDNHPQFVPNRYRK